MHTNAYMHTCMHTCCSDRSICLHQVLQTDNAEDGVRKKERKVVMKRTVVGGGNSGEGGGEAGNSLIY